MSNERVTCVACENAILDSEKVWNSAVRIWRCRLTRKVVYEVRGSDGALKGGNIVWQKVM